MMVIPGRYNASSNKEDVMYNFHKRTAWGCRGCGRIPNVEKL